MRLLEWFRRGDEDERPRARPRFLTEADLTEADYALIRLQGATRSEPGVAPGGFTPNGDPHSMPDLRR